MRDEMKYLTIESRDIIKLKNLCTHTSIEHEKVKISFCCMTHELFVIFQ